MNNIPEKGGHEESTKWILEKIEIDPMVDLSKDNNTQDNLSKCANGICLMRSNSSVRKRNNNNGVQVMAPKMGRMTSGVSKGIKSLRFLDRTVTGKEADAWKSIEKRFYQHALDERLARDKFGVCIGGGGKKNVSIIFMFS